ncbi:MAG: glutamate racemase, partial [Sphingomonas taxi]
AGDCRVIRHGSAALVTLAETKLRGETVPIDAVRAAIAPMLAAPGGEAIDTVVLACTHFPLLGEELRAAIDRPVTFVDGGEGIARRIAYLTQGQPFAPSRPDTAVFTGSVEPALEAALASYGFTAIERL